MVGETEQMKGKLGGGWRKKGKEKQKVRMKATGREQGGRR